MATKLYSILGFGKLERVSNDDSVVSPLKVPTSVFDVAGGRTITSDLPERDFEIRPTPKRKIVSSKESNIGSFLTLFNDFNFKAIPFYNFWESDEEENETDEIDGRDLKDIPRFVKLVWRMAPETDFLSVTKNPPTDKRTRGFSRKIRKRSNKNVKGFTFNEDKKESFSVYRKSTVNGVIDPGTISCVVDIPLDSASSTKVKQTLKVDEHLFLTSEMTDGLLIHDIQANINGRFNGDNIAAKAEVQSKSKFVGSIKDDLFSGRYAFNKLLRSRRSPSVEFSDTFGVTVKSIASDSANLQMTLNTAHQSSAGSSLVTDKNDDPLEFIIFETVRTNPTPRNTKKSIEVNFVDPAITGLVNESKVNLVKDVEHAENIIEIAPFITNLCILSDLDQDISRKKDIISFPGTKEELGTEYVGYVIEKYKQNENGVFVLVEEIEIPDREITSYIDTKVSYASTYRYRIKSILRWTRKGNSSDFDNIQTKQLAPYKSSYFESEWSRNWQYAAIADTLEPDPPDELTVRPESHKGRIVVSWKLPYNPQNDIHYYILYRKTTDENGNDLSDWEQLDVKIGANNVIYFDNDVRSFQESGLMYVYSAQCVTRHSEYSPLSCQIGARLNDSFIEFGEYPVKSISGPGVVMGSVGAFSRNPIKRYTSNVVAKEKVSLSPRDGRNYEPFTGNTYCIRFTSLSTGEKKDVIIDLSYDDIKPDIKTVVAPITNNEQEGEIFGGDPEPRPSSKKKLWKTGIRKFVGARSKLLK